MAMLCGGGKVESGAGSRRGGSRKQPGDTRKASP